MIRYQSAQSGRKSIRLLLVIAFLQGMVFYAPVATLYRTAAGVSLGQIAWIESISYLLMIVLEVPWGLVTARIGYKNTLVISCALFFFSKIVFWRAQSFSGFLAERILLAVVLTGFSGCDSAYLYLCAGDADAQRVFGRYDAAGTAGLLCASAVFSGFLGEHYRPAALLTVLSYGAAALLALFLHPVPLTEADAAPIRAQLRTLWHSLRRKPRFLIFLLACTCFSEVCQFVTVFLSQPVYALAGLGPAAMGACYIAVTLAGLSGAASHRVMRALGARRFGPLLCAGAALVCVVLACMTGAAFSDTTLSGAAFADAALSGEAPACAAFADVAFADAVHAGAPPSGTFQSVLCVLCVVLLGAASALFAPYAATCQNRQAADGARAVLLSGYAMVGSLGSSALNAALGGMADVSLSGVLWLCAGLCALACLCLLRWERRGGEEPAK